MAILDTGEDMKRWGVFTISILLLLSFAILTGCSAMTVKLGWVGNSVPGHSEASFSRFRGEERYSMQLQGGETLVLRYEAELEEGSLVLRFLNSGDAVVWEEGMDSDAVADVRIKVEEAGWYDLVVYGDDARGRFDLYWSMD